MERGIDDDDRGCPFKYDSLVSVDRWINSLKFLISHLSVQSKFPAQLSSFWCSFNSDLRWLRNYFNSFPNFYSKSKDVIVKIEEKEESEEDFASKEHHILVELFQALWYVVLSHTDFICYAMVFLNQVRQSFDLFWGKFRGLTWAKNKILMMQSSRQKLKILLKSIFSNLWRISHKFQSIFK